METYTTRGKIYKIFPEEQITDRFKKQEFVIQSTAQGRDTIVINFAKFQLINNKTSILQDIEKGDFVVVKFNISGRKVDKGGDQMFFTNLDVQEMTVVHKASEGLAEFESEDDQDYSNMLPGLDPMEKKKEEEGSLFDDDNNDLPF